MVLKLDIPLNIHKKPLVYSITYLSKNDRERLIELQELIRSTMSEQERIGHIEEMGEINSRIKPLKECTIEQCSELKTEIWSKIQQVQSIGKLNILEQFQQRLLAVEEYERWLITQQQKQQVDKDDNRVKENNSEIDGIKNSKGKTKLYNKSKWTTGIGNLD